MKVFNKFVAGHLNVSQFGFLHSALRCCWWIGWGVCSFVCLGWLQTARQLILSLHYQGRPLELCSLLSSGRESSRLCEGSHISMLYRSCWGWRLRRSQPTLLRPGWMFCGLLHLGLSGRVVDFRIFVPLRFSAAWVANQLLCLISGCGGRQYFFCGCSSYWERGLGFLSQLGSDDNFVGPICPRWNLLLVALDWVGQHGWISSRTSLCGNWTLLGWSRDCDWECPSICLGWGMRLVFGGLLSESSPSAHW